MFRLGNSEVVMSAPHVAVCFARGFEEIEAVTIVDVLRRGEVNVTMASIEEEEWVVGAHDIAVRVDAWLGELEPEQFAMVVLPGGMPGAENIKNSDLLQGFVRNVWDQGGHACAICAGPLALHAAGLLTERQATSYPSFAEQLSGVLYLEDDVVSDTRLVTSRGPATAIVFALRLLEELGLGEKAEELREAMLVK